MQVKKNKKYKVISFLFKAAIIIVAFWFIYKQVFIKHDFEEIKKTYLNIYEQANFRWLMSVTFLLMFVNWGLEAMKWKLMISKIENMSFVKSLQAVFSGVTVSFFTPNRVGEFGGRVFYLEKADRIQAAIITILGSMCQLLVTIIFGGLSLLFFIKKYPEKLFLDNPPSYIFYFIDFFVVVIIALIMWIYFNTSLWKTFLNKISYFKKHENYSSIFSFYSEKDLRKILSYSVIRYIVFTTQFLLLLHLMNVQIPIIEGVVMIAMTYLIMAVPTIALTEFGIRGAVAVYFIGMLSQNHLGIITASFSLWFINLAIPALLGALFVFNLKFFRGADNE